MPYICINVIPQESICRPLVFMRLIRASIKTNSLLCSRYVDLHSVWKSLKKVLYLVHYITFLSLYFPYCYYIHTLSLHSTLIITFPYCPYIPFQSLHSHLIITLHSYHYISLLSLQSLPIITFPPYQYISLSSPPHLIITFSSYFDNFDPS